MLVPNVVTMSSREIAKLTGKNHQHVMRDLRNLEAQLGDMFEGVVQTWTHPQNKQSYEEFLLNKDTCLTLLLGYDAVARMKVVKRWQELENREANRVPVEETTKLELLFIESFSRTCNVSESGKLGMYRRLAKNRGLDVKLLPGYAVDEPKGIITTGSSAPTNSLTELLKEHGVKKENGKFYRAVDINPLLANKGILERKSRKSSSGEDKFFWSLTTTGEAYGKNLTSDANPRETQPHYFSNKFAELLELIGL